MALATSKYHITLNAAGYTLHPQSYKLKAQPPFTPRFSTGDPSLGDLSYWQYIAQEEFGGGVGQTLFNDKGRINKCVGWDIGDGKPRMSSAFDLITLSTAIPNLGLAGDHHKAKFVVFNNDLILVCPPNSGNADGTLTLIFDGLGVSANIYHLNAWDAVAWNRDGNIGTSNQFLAVSYHDGTNYAIKFLDEDYNTDESYAVAGSTTFYVTLVPISGNAILRVGYNTSDNLLLIERLQYTANTWSDRVVSGFHQAMRTFRPLNCSYAIDSAGTVYLACKNNAYDTAGTLSKYSYIIRITAADLASVNPRISSTEVVERFAIWDIFDIAGVVYFSGAEQYPFSGPTAGSSYTSHPTIVRYPNIIVFQIKNGGSTTHSDNAIRCGLESNSQGVFFGGCWTDSFENAYDANSTLYVNKLSPQGVVLPVAFIPFATTFPGPEPGIAAICDFAGAIYIFNRIVSTTGGIYKSAWTRSGVQAYAGGGGSDGGFAAPGYSAGAFTTGKAVLALSEMGGNTPLIQKTLYSVKIELGDAALTTAQTLQIHVNGTLVATMVPGDGTSKEFVLTAELSAVGFRVELSLVNLNVAWYGYLKRVTLRYLPTQYKKYAWALGLRLEKHQKLLDGQPETDTPITKIAALKTAWQSNVPITYVDVDGTSYTVIVTDFQVQRPVIANDRDRLEAIAFVELLEV